MGEDCVPGHMAEVQSSSENALIPGASLRFEIAARLASAGNVSGLEKFL